MPGGSCHCGAVRFALDGPAPERCRLCTCDYCRKAGPRWWSDPACELRIDDAEQRLVAYRFGSKTADFLFCGRCGVLLAARCTIEGHGYAVLNLNNVEGLDAAALPSTPFSFEGEDVAARLSRRRRNWSPATITAA
ncbi:MAG TPA: hypothetical protein VM074_12195 [Solimonas sp.]|nr:hypothetical protein [Solimonas sp.]